MIDHVSIGVAEIERSLAFYERALAPLGIKRLKAYGGTNGRPAHVGFGHQQKPYFWSGTGDSMKGYVHVAFAADSREIVDAFYAAALSAGGRGTVRRWP